MSYYSIDLAPICFTIVLVTLLICVTCMIINDTKGGSDGDKHTDN